MRVVWGSGAALAAAVLLSGLEANEVIATRLAGPVSGVATATTTTRGWEHRYRIGGKVRLLLFWVGSDDVGGARMSSRDDPASGRIISFLAGSDPARAPRNLNQWGYALEHQMGDAARVFTVRSLNPSDGASPEARLAAGDGDVLFGAACSSLARNGGTASVTGVRVDPTVTFRRFDRLLSAIRSSPRWEQRRATPPADTYPGFFSALQSAIDDSVAGVTHGAVEPRVRRRPYVFNGALFDLIIRSVDPAAPGLLRGRYSYQNRETRERADFTVTFGTTGDTAAVPVEMSFTPSWWLKVRLTLDDRVDVPEDPASDTLVTQRIDEMCARVLDGGAAASTSSR